MTEKSLSVETLRTELLSFIKTNPKKNWPNFYADVRNFSVAYLKSTSPSLLTVVPDEAQYITITDNTSEGFVSPLIELAFEVVNFLRVAPVVDFKPTDYLSSRGGKIKWWKI